MLDFFENFVFFRTLNFLRIKHDFSTRYNLVYPSIISLVVCLSLGILGVPSPIFGLEGIIAQFLQLIGLLAPFYIAALAAVSTFQSENIKKEMKGKIKPHISLLKEGKWEPHYLSRRYFLSLLFSYCALNSLILFIVGVSAIFCANDIKEHLSSEFWIYPKLGFVFLYAFFFSHLLLTSIIGMYYLGDKLHRPE